MVNQCYICKSVSDASTSLFSIPKDDNAKKKWMEFIASNEAGKDLDCSYIFICSNHFHDDDFTNLVAFKLRGCRKLVLKPNAVPSIKFKNLTASSKTTKPSIADDTTNRLQKHSVIKKSSVLHLLSSPEMNSISNLDDELVKQVENDQCKITLTSKNPSPDDSFINNTPSTKVSIFPTLDSKVLPMSQSDDCKQLPTYFPKSRNIEKEYEMDPSLPNSSAHLVHSISLSDRASNSKNHGIIPAMNSPASTPMLPTLSQSDPERCIETRQSPEEMSIMKNLQTTTDEVHSKTDNSMKLKIRPIVSHSTLGQMMKIHGTFPIVYIGASRSTDFQPSSSKHKPLKDRVVDLNKGAANTDVSASLTGRNQNSSKDLNKSINVTAVATCSKSALVNEIASSSTTTPFLSNSVISKSAPIASAFSNETVSFANFQSALSESGITKQAPISNNDNYDLKKAMDGFLDTSESESNQPKVVKPPQTGLDPIPSLVVSGLKAFENCSKTLPVIKNRFNYPYVVPPVTPIQPLHYRSIFPSSTVPPRFQPYFSKSPHNVPLKTDVNKVGLNTGRPNGIVQPTPRPIVHQVSPGNMSVLFSDALKKKAFPTISGNKLKRKSDSSTNTGPVAKVIKPSAEPVLKIIKPDLLLKAKSNSTSLSPNSNKQDVKPVSSNNSFVYQVETSNAKDPNINAAVKGEPKRPVTHLKKYTSEVERLKAVSKSQNEKLAKKKVVKEEKLLPLPSAMTRPGVLVKFEDNVQLWIDKLRDLMYLDDEPVKSWKLEKGTEVAARYTDGLFYDAVILNTYEGQPTRGTKTSKNSSRSSTPKASTPKQKPAVVDLCESPHDKVKPMHVQSTLSTPSKSPPRGAEETTKPIKVHSQTPPLKSKKRGEESSKSCSSPDKSSVLTLPRVHIKKLDFREGSGDAWDVKLIDDNSAQPTLSDKPTKEETVLLQVKCPNCFLIFRSVTMFRKHQKTVCGCKGITVTSQIVNPDIMVVVDETEVPPLVSSFSRNGIPRDRDGKRCFRRGTHFLHRWQTDGGSKWYNGKILRILESKKGTKCQFEVEYIDDDHDDGPLVINLYEDYPHDIRIVTR